MLSNLLKEHRAQQAVKAEIQEQSRKEAILASNDLTQALVDHLNVGVAQAYLNQKKIDEEAKLLHHNVSNFSRQTQQWSSLIESFNSSLKQIGDLENWSTIIESDMKLITEALDHAYKSVGNSKHPVTLEEESSK